MVQAQPVRFAVAGMGGYAAIIADLLLSDGALVSPGATLAAVCDPSPATWNGRNETLHAHGVTVFDDFERMLDDATLDAVWLPVPIQLHRPFTERALSRGLAVVVEKPAAGTVDDVNAMIEARDRAGVPVVVGFQDVYDQTTLALKRRLLSGEIGRVRRATLLACAPRSYGYFQRNGWSGRMRVDDDWVLDSPANNALAHFLNLALFLLGPDAEHSAEPASLDAELYRAAAIENYDTLSARLRLPHGVELLTLLTHACREERGPLLVIEGDRGRVEWTRRTISIRTRHQQFILERGDERRSMLERVTKVMRGLDDPEVAVATLEVARAHTRVINAVSQATPVVTVPARHVERAATAFGRSDTIVGIEAAFERCAAEHRTLHELNVLPFTRRPGRFDLTRYNHFAGACPASDDRLLQPEQTEARP